VERFVKELFWEREWGVGVGQGRKRSFNDMERKSVVGFETAPVK
jgi:hypothetical protein